MKRLMVLLLCMCCTGCTALPAEERAFAVALCVEKPDTWRVHGRIPTYQSGGGYLTVTGQGESIASAIEDMDASAPLQVELSQLRLLAVDADVPIVEVAQALAGRMDVRQQCILAVTEASADAVMEALQPKTGTRLSKSIDLLAEARTGQGLIVRTTLADAARMGYRQFPVVSVLTVLDGQVDLDGAWAGARLNRLDTALLGLMLAETKSLHLPVMGGVDVRDVQSKVHLAEGGQRACVTLNMCAAAKEVSLPLPILEKVVADACLDLLMRMYQSGCDALGLGRKAICHVQDMSSWHAFNWPQRLRELQWEVTVCVTGPA